MSSIQAVITSIDEEHLDHYQSFEGLVNAFVEFANKVPFYGAAIVCLDDENVRAIVPLLRRRETEKAPSAAVEIVRAVKAGGDPRAGATTPETREPPETAIPGGITVVTADRPLAGRSRHHGADIVSPGEFIARCLARPDPG